VRLSEVEGTFDGFLRKGRPEGDQEASRWDLDLGASYQQLGKSMAWLHIVENVRRFREEAVERLVNGEDGADELRQVILTIDAILKMPVAMIEQASQAKAWLERNDNGR